MKKNIKREIDEMKPYPEYVGQRIKNEKEHQKELNTFNDWKKELNESTDINLFLKKYQPIFTFRHEEYMRKKIKTIRNISIFFLILIIIYILLSSFGSILTLIT